MSASKISELTAIVAADTASGDLLTLVDVSASQNMKITRDDLITSVANNVTGLTSALTGANSAANDLFLAYDTSASAMFDMTRDELSKGIAHNLNALLATIAGSATATDDTFWTYDTSAALLKSITRAELIIAVAANLASQSIANAALQNALVATTSLKVTSSGTACTKLLSATASLNFPSISTLTSEDLTVAVTGAAVGDAVFLGLPAAPTAGIVFNAFVSASDVVTVRAHNYTGGAIDPAGATYRVVVQGF